MYLFPTLQMTWCMVLYLEGQKINELCGIPKLSSDTLL